MFLTKKLLEFQVLDFDENLCEEPGWFQKKLLELPDGFCAVMSLILMMTVLYGMVFQSELGIRNMIVQIIILITPGILFLYEKMYAKLTKRERDVVLIDLWVIYVMLGKPYRVLDALLTNTHMRTQDLWWGFPVVIVILYGLGLFLEGRLTSHASGGILKAKSQEDK